MKKTQNKIGDIFKLSNVCRESWFIIHCLGRFEKKEELKDLFILFSKHFICPKCKRHIVDYITYNKIPSNYQETVNFHNAVNTRIKKENEDGKKTLLLIDSKKIFNNLKLIGFIYVYLMSLMYNLENLRKSIYEIFCEFNIITFKNQKDIFELWKELCERKETDKKIFSKNHYDKILMELKNEDYRSFI